MKIRPIFKTIDIFSFIQFLSRQTNYIIKFFLLKVLYLVYYMEYSTRIYQIYLKYIAPEDIVVYSIDEVFMDVTDYLNTYKLSAHDLAMKIILDVLETTGITATAGIGTNLFLCKVAMDIVAKHIPADKNGVRIAELDEMKFRRELWSHQYQLLMDAFDDAPEVTITYFQPDERKAGGKYVSATGAVKKVDDFERRITMQDGTKISMDDVLSIDGEVFSSLE